MSENIEEIAAALEAAAAEPTPDEPTEHTEPQSDEAPVGDADTAATDEADTETDVDDDTEGDEADEHEPDPVEFKRIQDAQRKMHEQAAEIKQLKEQLQGKGAEADAEPEQEAPANLGMLTLEAVKEAIGTTEDAMVAYGEALGRGDVFEAVPLVIAATEAVDPVLAEKMRLDFAQQVRTMSEQSAQASEALVREVASTTTDAFFESWPEEREHIADLTGVLDANPVMQQWYESGDPAQVSFALDMARHVRRSLAMDAPATPKVDPAADAQAKRERAAARGLDTGKGAKAPKVSAEAGKDAEHAAGLVEALGFLGVA